MLTKDKHDTSSHSGSSANHGPHGRNKIPTDQVLDSRMKCSPQNTFLDTGRVLA